MVKDKLEDHHPIDNECGLRSVVAQAFKVTTTLLLTMIVVMQKFQNISSYNSVSSKFESNIIYLWNNIHLASKYIIDFLEVETFGVVFNHLLIDFANQLKANEKKLFCYSL